MVQIQPAKEVANRTIRNHTPRTRTRSSFGECLEDRRLLAASLASIPNVSVPSLQGLTLPLDGSGTPDAQTFSATSSNPDIAVSIASTTFWNVGVSYTDPLNSNNSFSGTLTFGLFGSLTPNTVKMITQFTNDSYYVNSGKFIWRVASNFDETTSAVIQGGAANPQGNIGVSGQPGTPFGNENVQALAPTGSNQLLLANAGGTDSNDVQFFIDTGPLDSQLGYGYTLFGQLVSGAGTLAKIAGVPVTTNDFGEPSQPVNPITITSTSLSTSNDSGVVLIDTTQAHPGETAIVTVTAHDGSSSTPQSFLVSVGSYAGSTVPSLLEGLNFKPFASPVSISANSNISEPVQLAGQPAEPLNAAPVSSYTILTGPSHGTISDFNPATGKLLYTSAPGFVGTDSFTYTASSSGPNTLEPPATSNPATVTITVTRGYVELNSVEVFTNGRGKDSKIELFWSGPLERFACEIESAVRDRNRQPQGLLHRQRRPNDRNPEGAVRRQCRHRDTDPQDALLEVQGRPAARTRHRPQSPERQHRPPHLRRQRPRHRRNVESHLPLMV